MFRNLDGKRKKRLWVCASYYFIAKTQISICYKEILTGLLMYSRILEELISNFLLRFVYTDARYL